MTAMHTATQRIQAPVTVTAAKASAVQEHADAKVTAKDVQQRQAEGTPVTTENNVNEEDEEDEQDDDYNEEEDEDYVGEDAKGTSITENSTNGVKVADADADDKDNDDDDDDDDDEEDYIEEEDKREMAKYSSIESSTGGLIKTRKQRMTEELEEKKKKKDLALKSTSGGSSDVNIDSIWAELNNTKPQVPQVPQKTQETSSISTSTSNSTPITISSQQSSKANSPSTQTPLEQEKIKITSTYEFAGKTVTEEKWVDKDSQEAKAYLNSAKLTSKLESDKAASTAAAAAAENGTPKKPLLRRKRKRESLLDAVISNSSKTKLSTLEKSRLDWATYVDKNKINDELKYKNKSGFLEKQDFLNRVESRRDDLYKNAKSKSQKE